MKVLREVYHNLRSFFGVNWIKTLYFNFRMFSFNTACKLPVYFYGPVRLQNLSGKIIIDAPVKRGMIGFGHPYEKNTVHRGTAEIILAGTLILKGFAQFGKDYFISIDAGATVRWGNMSSLGSAGKIICTDSISVSDYVRFGGESQLLDTTLHQMVNTITGEKYPMSSPINIGNYNYIGNRTTVMKGTITPDYCTVGSNSLCNKDYTSLGNNILIGGIPAKLIRRDISRDWVGEKELLPIWMGIK